MTRLIHIQVLPVKQKVIPFPLTADEKSLFILALRKKLKLSFVVSTSYVKAKVHWLGVKNYSISWLLSEQIIT